jgi:hypothetical protein
MNSTTKTLSAILITIVLQITLHTGNGYAQTKATGHIFAEIVESVSTTSRSAATIDLKNSYHIQSASSAHDPGNEDLDLGEITIVSGRDVECHLAITPVVLSGPDENGPAIETFLSGHEQTNIRRTWGNQTVRMKGKARLSEKTKSGTYRGSYHMTFIYN